MIFILRDTFKSVPVKQCTSVIVSFTGTLLNYYTVTLFIAFP